jgi:hypothetical protein
LGDRHALLQVKNRKPCLRLGARNAPLRVKNKKTLIRIDLLSTCIRATHKNFISQHHEQDTTLLATLSPSNFLLAISLAFLESSHQSKFCYFSALSPFDGNYLYFALTDGGSNNKFLAYLLGCLGIPSNDSVSHFYPVSTMQRTLLGCNRK